MGFKVDGPLRRVPEALEFLLEEERLGEAEMGQRLDGAASTARRAAINPLVRGSPEV